MNSKICLPLPFQYWINGEHHYCVAGWVSFSMCALRLISLILNAVKLAHTNSHSYIASRRPACAALVSETKQTKSTETVRLFSRRKCLPLKPLTFVQSPNTIVGGRREVVVWLPCAPAFTDITLIQRLCMVTWHSGSWDRMLHCVKMCHCDCFNKELNGQY